MSNEGSTGIKVVLSLVIGFFGLGLAGMISSLGPPLGIFGQVGGVLVFIALFAVWKHKGKDEESSEQE